MFLQSQLQTLSEVLFRLTISGCHLHTTSFQGRHRVSLQTSHAAWKLFLTLNFKRFIYINKISVIYRTLFKKCLGLLRQVISYNIYSIVPRVLEEGLGRTGLEQSLVEEWRRKNV